MNKHAKSLLLLRHAKSSWSNSRLKDFDRPLNARGLVAAPVIADYVAEKMPLADVILCSTSQRTRETLSAVLHVYRHPVRVMTTRDLYMASSEDVIGVLKSQCDQEKTVMIIGHNPAMEDTALKLAAKGAGRYFRTIQEKYPTASCAHISFELPSWTKIAPDMGALEDFIRPRDLMGSEEF